MISQDPLAALQPLREPEAIGWWPLAPGWWFLVLVVVSGIALALLLIYRRYHARRYRRLGVAQLKRLYAAYCQHGDSREFITAGNALLKSVALQAYPAQEVAACHGSQWALFLNERVSGNPLFDPSFSESIYQEYSEPVNSDDFHKAAVHWIKHHRIGRGAVHADQATA